MSGSLKDWERLARPQPPPEGQPGLAEQPRAQEAGQGLNRQGPEIQYMPQPRHPPQGQGAQKKPQPEPKNPWVGTPP